jgi:hypothetical protein
LKLTLPDVAQALRIRFPPLAFVGAEFLDHTIVSVVAAPVAAVCAVVPQAPAPMAAVVIAVVPAAKVFVSVYCVADASTFQLLPSYHMSPLTGVVGFTPEEKFKGGPLADDGGNNHPGFDPFFNNIADFFAVSQIQ